MNQHFPLPIAVVDDNGCVVSRHRSRRNAERVIANAQSSWRRSGVVVPLWVVEVDEEKGESDAC